MLILDVFQLLHFTRVNMVYTKVGHEIASENERSNLD